MNCIPRNKHFIKHRVVNKCNKINCCSNVDLRIKTHRINNRDVTFGPVVLSKDLLRILQNHVKKIAINSSQKHFYLTCRICNKILISKYIYSHIMKQYWYLNLCSYNDTYGYTENCDIFSKYAYDAHQYVFKISNSNDNRHSIIISLDLLEYLNIKNLLSICHSNIKIKNKRDIFQKIKGFYLDYHSKDYDDKFIKEIPKQNRIEEMRGLIIKDINNIH